MKSPRVGAVIALSAAAWGGGCTWLVSFDDRGDARCGDSTCDGTLRDASSDGSVEQGAASPPDGAHTVDAGDCSLLSEGESCAKGGACRGVSTCHAGACAAHIVPDGTMCGAAPDGCHLAPTCASGACTPAPEAPDGAPCGAALDACHARPTCAHGACGAALALPDGTSWNTGDGHARCCGGRAVETTTSENCGVCGWSCSSGQSCGTIDGEYLCLGCTLDSDCASGCCSSSPGPNHCSPSDCAGACRSNVCTGGSHCVNGAVDYCAY